jgi:two-component sensor histidine kinase
VLTNCLYLQDIQPRRWSAREIDLVQDVADRTWEAFERARAEETKSLLINELNHRVRNTLAVVGAIASQTRRHSSSLKDFGRAFDGRVQALAATHTLLSDSKWADSGLHILIERQLIPFTQRANTIDISGPAVVLGPKRALALSLVLHELGTNAAKFGALSTTTGHIDSAWTVSQELGDRTLLLRWTERGGPPVQSPVQIGFGTKLIDHNISHEFGGEVEREFHADGFTCTMTIPLPQSSDAS